MRILPWTIFAGAIVGNDLHTAVVRGSIFGVSASAGPVLRDALSLAPDEARRMLREAPRGAPFILVLPTTMVGVRPTALPADRWSAARAEVMRSIETLFPFPAAETLVGFIARRVSDKERAGYLAAADRRLVQPWLDAMGRLLGKPVDAVLPAHAALLGAGYQRAERAEVASWTGAQWASHRLAWGEITDLNAPRSADGSLADAALPSDRSDAPTNAPMGGADVAAAGALAMIVAPDQVAPLVGRVPHPSRHWLAAAAMVALGGVLLWSSGPLARWRYERAMDQLTEAESARAPVLAEVESSRRRAVELAARLESLRKLFADSGPGVLAAADAAQSAMPADAFLYRVEVDSGAVTLKGEARRAGDVLRAVEDRQEFQAARELDTPITVEERGFEMFNIRAERVPPAKGGVQP